MQEKILMHSRQKFHFLSHFGILSLLEFLIQLIDFGHLIIKQKMKIGKIRFLPFLRRSFDVKNCWFYARKFKFFKYFFKALLLARNFKLVILQIFIKIWILCAKFQTSQKKLKLHFIAKIQIFQISFFKSSFLARKFKFTLLGVQSLNVLPLEIRVETNMKMT